MKQRLKLKRKPNYNLATVDRIRQPAENDDSL